MNNLLSMLHNVILAANPHGSDLDGVFEVWKDTITGTLLSIATKLLCPVLSVVCVIVIVVLIGKIIAARQEPEYDRGTSTKYVWGIVTCAIGVALFGSFSVWGYMFL